MTSVETRSKIPTTDFQPVLTPHILAETGQLPATETEQVLGERALVTTASPAIDAAPDAPVAKGLIPAIEPQVEEVAYKHPLMTPPSSTLTPQERIDAARRRYGSGDAAGSAQNRLDARRRNTDRVRNGYEPYSPVRKLLGGYEPGFRR